MDGLLIDSEVLWHEAEVEIFAELGVDVAITSGRTTKGMFVSEVVEYWYARHPWVGIGTQDVVERLLDRVAFLVETRGVLLPGAVDALDLAARYGPVALASSTPLELIERCLAHFSLRDRFASVHSAEHEPYGKPHPAVFLSAASSLEVAPPACLVFEDSSAGVLAAKAARMSVVAVPSADDRGEAAFALADLVLDSLEELREDWMAERYQRPAPRARHEVT